MARSGTIYGNTQGGYQWYIEWEQSSIDEANNRSIVNAVMCVKKVGSNTQSYNNNWHKANLTIHGGETGTSTQDVQFDMRNASIGAVDQLAAAGTYMYHNADGTLSVTISGYHDLSGISLGYQSVSGTVTLDAIPPKKSTISSISGGTFGSEMTVNINRKSSSYTTTVWVQVPGNDWHCVVSKTSSTSIKFTVPASLIGQVGNATGVNANVIIRTHNGNSDIGDDSWSHWIGIPKSTISSISGDTFGSNMTVNIWRAHSNITTTVWIQIPGNDWHCVASGSTSTSISFTVPTSLISQIGSGTGVTAKVIIRSYNGSASLGDNSWDRWIGIPKSTISSITGGTIGGSMTVNINRPDSSLTTSVWVKVGSLDWQNVIWKSTSTSLTFTVPNVLANQITNSTTADGTVKIRTYKGDTELGDNDWTKQFIVPDGMRYSITNVTKDTDTQINGQWKFIKTKSKLRVNITTDNSNAYGATIKEYKFTFDGKTYYGNGTWTGVINSSGSKSISVTVTDSRNRTATYSTSINVVDYQPPWGSISAFRCDANGNKDNKNGTYVKVQYSGDRSSVDGANTFSLDVTHRESDKTWSENDAWSGTPVSNGSMILSGYSKDKTYEIRLRVNDWYTSTSYSVPISTVDVPLDYRAGGTGIGIGRYCLDDHTIQTNKAFEIYTGRNGEDKGADVNFYNVSNESQSIGWCGGLKSSNNTLLQLYRYTTSASGAGQKGLFRLDNANHAYYNFGLNYFKNPISFYGDSTVNEGVIKYENSDTYIYLHNPKYSNSSVGVWSANVCVWEYDSPSQTLMLKSGYGTTSDARLKRDFNEFEDWDKYYNFFMSLKPLTFKYIDDNRRDTFMGLIAQDVAESIESSGLGDKNLCIAKHHENEEMDDGKEYTLSYQELIPLNIKMIQKHENDIKELKDKVALFKETVKKLKKE